MGRDRKIVHVKANDDVPYKFISFEYDPRGASVCFPVRDREDIIIITLSSLEERVIKEELALLNHNGGGSENIHITLAGQVRSRGREIPNASEYGPSSRWEQVGGER